MAGTANDQISEGKTADDDDVVVTAVLGEEEEEEGVPFRMRRKREGYNHSVWKETQEIQGP